MKEVKSRKICGDSYVTKPAVLSENGENLFVSWRNSVYTYCVKTGKRLNEFRGIKNGLVGFSYICKDGKEVVAAASTNTNIYIWDVPTTALLERTELRKRNRKVVDFQLIDVNFVKEKVEYKALIVLQNDLRNTLFLYNSTTKKFKRIASLLKEEPYKCAIGGDEQKYAMVVSRNNWIFARLDTMKKKRGIISKGMEFTAVACHPTEECVLTGDNTGRILMYHDFSGNVPTRAKFHWHSLPIRTLCFSPTGTSFYSGGEEAVLVKWNTDDYRNREFLPRLPATIKHVAVSANNTDIVVSTEDNALHILDPQFKTKQIIQQYVASGKQDMGIVYDERSKCLVFNGISGHIQFFQPHDSNLLYSLDIVGQNRVTGEREFEVQTADVTGIAFSRNGVWMATIEQRINTSLDKEIKLKFWKYESVDQRFHLNTSIDFPHTEQIIKVTFQSTNKDNLKCVTISKDGKFKVWEVSNVKTIYREGHAWKCMGAAYYKNQLPSDACFSSDSSLLAVAFGSILTTWLPDTCELKCSLLHPNQHHRNLCQIAFGNGNQCHLIVTATKREVSVWNLLTLSMIWTAAADVSLLLADPYSSYMAVFTKNKKLILFTPKDSKPIYTNTKICKQKDYNPVSGVFVRNLNSSETTEWYEKSQLYILDSSSNIHCIEASSNVEEQDIIETDIKSSIFSYMTPLQKATNVNVIKPVIHEENNLQFKQKQIKDFLDSPVHTMPPMRILCRSILQALIEKDAQISRG